MNMDNYKDENMKVTERLPIQSGAVKGCWWATRTFVTSIECMEARAGIGDKEEEVLAERATCDQPDNEISRE